MAKIQMSTHVDAPQQEVFEVFTDLGKAEERIQGIKKMELLTDGPVGVGTRFRETRVMFGKEATEVMEISAFDAPNSYLVTAGSCGCEYATTWRFTPEGAGTRVDVEFSGTPVTFMAKLMSPLMSLMSGTLKKCLAADMDDLKRAIAETHAAV